MSISMFVNEQYVRVYIYIYIYIYMDTTVLVLT